MHKHVTAPFEALFLPSSANGALELFAVHHPPQGEVTRGLVVYAQPFAEEMNKSRRMAALQARALAACGHAVLQIDLFGCGDSAGNFEQVSWDRWINDVVDASLWLLQRHSSALKQEGQAPALWLWGLRSGALLASAAGARLNTQGHSPNFLLWQSAVNGKAVLQQFLRLKTTADMMAGRPGTGTAVLRQEIALGATVEVAGYALNDALCSGLEQAELIAPPGTGQLVWMEVSPREGATLGPASLGALDAWQEQGWATAAQVLQGPAFWQTTEIEDAPELLRATTAALLAAGAAA